MQRRKKTSKVPARDTESKQGFTLIEVMLFLGIAGLLLIGILGGTYTAIGRQRYTDSLRSFAEYLRAMYNEVLSPESLGFGGSGNAVLGKLLVFRPDPKEENKVKVVESATIIGNAKIPETISGGFMSELKEVNARLYCGGRSGTHITADPDDNRYRTSVATYDILWQSWLTNPDRTLDLDSDNPGSATQSPFNRAGDPFVGSIIIARSPTNGVVHTIYINEQYDLKNGCTPDNLAASERFSNDVQTRTNAFQYTDIGFCVDSDEAIIRREVNIAEDGRNTSAVKIMDAESIGGERRCR